MSLAKNLIEAGMLQGCVINAASLSEQIRKEIMDCRAEKSSRDKPVTADRCLVILSQDCDIANGNNPNIELVVLAKAKARDANNPILAKARNLRKLIVLHDDTNWLCSESLISVVPKDLFINDTGWRIVGHLDPRQLEILRRWRVNRYYRDPLPDAFNQAFISKYLHDEGADLRRFLESNRAFVNDLFAYVWPKSEGAPRYWVSLTAVLTLKCRDAMADVVESTLREYVDNIQKDNANLYMLQASGNPFEEHGNDKIPTMSLVSKPEDFSMFDVMMMSRLTLDYLCWPDDGSDE